ncbi:MAG: hypothetical protein ACTHPD_06515, partial [Rhizomicrobium sp.]
MVRVREFAAVASVAMLAMSAAYWTQRIESNSAVQAAVAKWIPDFSHETIEAKAEPAKPIAATQLAAVGQPPRPLSVPVNVAKAKLVLPPPKVIAVAPRLAEGPAPARPIAPPPAVETDGASAQAVAVAERVRQSVPAELFP